MTTDLSHQMFNELLDSRADLLTQIRERGLSVEQVTDWAMEGRNLQRVRVMCGLFDLQAQAALSRYRMLAINRLYQLASLADPEHGKDDRHTRETARRACVDLVRLELRRAYRGARRSDTEPAGEEAALRAMLYGAAAEASDPAGAGGGDVTSTSGATDQRGRH